MAKIALIASLVYLTFAAPRTPRVAATDFVLPDVTVVEGKLYRRAELDRALADWNRHINNPPLDSISTRVARSTLDSAVLRNY